MWTDFSTGFCSDMLLLFWGNDTTDCLRCCRSHRHTCDQRPDQRLCPGRNEPVKKKTLHDHKSCRTSLYWRACWRVQQLSFFSRFYRTTSSGRSFLWQMDNNPILIYFCRALFPRPCQPLPAALQRFDEEVTVAGCGKRESFGAGSASQDPVIGRSVQSEPSLRGREGEFATWTMTQLIMGANAGNRGALDFFV